MNILYIADPNSIHDVKWITYFSKDTLNTVYVLPRSRHYSPSTLYQNLGATLLEPIPDFSIIRFYRTLLTAKKINSIIMKHNIQLLHILYAEPNALWSIFRIYFKIRIIISARGTDVLKTIPHSFQHRNILNFLVSKAYKKAFRLADWVTGTSNTQLTSIKKFSGRTQNISVIHTGVNIKYFTMDTKKYFPENLKEPFVLFPRYLRPIYNHEFCLDAIELLPQEILREYRMVFVGRDSGDDEYQNLLMKRMGTLKKASFCLLPKLEQKEIFEIYKRSSVVVMTPISDGTPVSAMEALGCGAKLILGPLNYDNTIFNDAKKLTAWNKAELAQLIVELISMPSKGVSSSFFTLIDRQIEMEKLKEIYLRLHTSKNGIGG
ncbi:MAG TPA: glycosyltransferase family 4 protein [Cyclobacteriaceae bacterium]|nr:glycosyltransferase family 4 protein [Cyclobacteriaceae bacterium]